MPGAAAGASDGNRNDDDGPAPPPASSTPSASAQSAPPAPRTLYLAGVGEAVGTDLEELRRALEAFGPLDDDGEADGGSRGSGSGAIETFAGKGYVLARFREAGDAARAKEGMDGRVMQGRPLTVQFSTLPASSNGDESEGATGPPPEPLDPCDCEAATIPGLELVEDFLSPEEEAALLAFADRDAGAHWATGAALGMPGMGRRVQHYGHTFDYATRGVDFEGEKSGATPPPLPFHACPEFAGVVARLLRAGLLKMAPDQMTVNEYLPGQGIAGHIETHDAFRDGLLSLSLGAPVVMDFREPATGQRKALLLPTRSALALHGEARYLWAHAIAARTWDKVDGARVPRTGRRLSFTLRRVIPPLDDGTDNHHHHHEQRQQRRRQRRPCLCPFPDRCPTSPPETRAAYLASCRRGDGVVVPPEARRPTPLERSNVHAVYETISTHWNHTRAIRRVHWPRVVGFLQSLPPHALIADIGCGDGKYLELRRYAFHPTAFALGCDRSVRLLACAARQRREEEEEEDEKDKEDEGKGKEKREPPPEVFACDVLQVPFRDNAFDAALCIAVLHHLSTEAHRVQALRELCRVVRVGGLFDVHVWALEQEDGSRRRFDGQDQLVPFRMQAKYAAQPLETLAATASAASSSSNATAPKAATTPSSGDLSSSNRSSTTTITTLNDGGGDGGSNRSSTTTITTLDDGGGAPPIVEAVPASVDTAAKLVTYERYCHVYREWELEALLNKLGNEFELEIVDRGYDKGNWFVTVRKVGDALVSSS